MAKDAYNASKSNLQKARAAKAAYNSNSTAGASASANSASLEKFKMEAAKEVGVDLNAGGELTSKEAGSVGGQMVKNMVKSYKNSSSK